MTKETTEQTIIIDTLRKTLTRFLTLIESFDQNSINKIPFQNSWTAAQVADHVTKSNRSIAKALLLKGTESNRAADERVPELRSLFLNFNTKLKSPDFILPDNGNFDKAVLIANLAHSIEKIKELSETTEVSVMINHPAFGDITKYEILHFVVYHTERHSHQLENIFRTLQQ